MATLLLILLGAATASALTQEAGDACTTPSGAPGTCTDIRECAAVRLSLRAKSPVICGFQGVFPIVCCPAPEVVPSTDTDVSAPNITFECGISKPRVISQPLDASRRRRSDDDLLRRRLRSERARFVVGGKMSVIDAWPWMALLGRRSPQGTNWFCGGVLINEQWVLTALHCFFDFPADVVRLGEHDYNKDTDGATHQDFNVADTVIYPDFTPPAAYHDLALLRLESKVTIKRAIRPVCLPWGPEIEKNMTGEATTLTGWGDTSLGGFPSTTLQEVDLVAFPSSRCDDSYSILPKYAETWPQGIGQETLCAGHPDGGRDSCQGDSGGPLVSQNADRRFVLAGIVSQGYGCGNQDYPGLYGNLRHAPYLAWIKKVAFSSL